MGDLEDNGTDQASIKPVSSLRSIFETKTRNDTSSTTRSCAVTPRPLTKSDRMQDGSPMLTRASLDIPRTPSPWSISNDADDSQGRGIPGPPVQRPRRPNSRIFQRPLSTTSVSALQSTPLVTIDPPRSPPKLPQPINQQHSSQSMAPRPLAPVNVVPRSPLIVPVPTKRLRESPATDPQGSRANDPNDVLESKQLRRLSDDYSSTRNLPPPVNRAEKPKVPIKPTLIPWKASLEPLALAADKRVSPFSTPPSSNEGAETETPKFSRVNEAKFRHTGPRKPGEDEAYQPETLRSHHGAQHAGKKAATPGKQRPDARSFGFAAAADSDPYTSVPEAPPGLPPRLGQHQRVASTQMINAGNKNKVIVANIPLHDRSKAVQTTPEPVPQFLPPPKRTSMPISSNIHHLPNPSLPRTVSHSGESNVVSESSAMGKQDPESTTNATTAADYPDASNTNRCPPFIKNGVEEIDTNYDTRLIDICGPYVVTTGHITRAWDVVTGEMVLSVGHGEKEVRVTSLAFKPAATAIEEGSNLWLGTNYGEIQEVHIPTRDIVYVKTGAHERREVVKIHRHQSSMWTLDDSGRLCVWLGNEIGLPDLRQSPMTHRVPKGHTFSLIIQDDLWLATGKDIRIFRPSTADGAAFSILKEPLSQPGVGAVTSGAIIGGQLDRVYFGHADGKVTVYSTIDFTCLGVVNVSVYKISCLAGAGSHLWAGYSTGTVYVYDTRTWPWTTKKDWLAHSSPILNILVERSSLWKDCVLRVVSLGADNALRFWDGTLKDDWLATNMQDHDIEYCSFRELTALVISWNAGAATPTHLRYEERDSQFFNDVLKADMPPDLLVFGFQELVDLEDKKLTAKTLLKGNKKKDPLEQEHMSRQYRAWRDYLVRYIEDTMPSSEPYHLLHTASMVGLFSCVFIKASQRNRVRNLNAAEIKRGMGGLHGNKGALILRFILDDSSVCLVNCHLAAGQTQTVNRNNDITAILESAMFPPSRSASADTDTFVGGGDGSMILDHEICILHGDLNYRIDTMGRDTVVKAVNAKNLWKLLERDQLLVSRRRNPAFRVRAFKECPITFDPTYKYDVGSDRYDTSEKRRAPAWCDRILYRGTGKIKQIDYRRHDLRISDHRPVTGRFKIRIKAIYAEKRAAVWKDSESRYERAREELAYEAKVEYLRDVLGVPPNEARRLI